MQDSVAVRYFSVDPTFTDAWPLADLGDPSEPVFVSPDGAHFFFVTHSGDMGCDCNRYELSVYSVAQVKRALSADGGMRVGPLAPLHTAEMRTTASGMGLWPGGIRVPYWSGDTAVVFTGSTAENQDSLYRLDVRTGKLQRLTDAAHEMLGQYQLQGDSIAYFSYTPVVREGPLDVIRYPFEAIRGTRLGELYSQRELKRYRTQVVVSASAGATTHVAASYVQPSSSYANPSKPLLSPDGRWAVVVLPAYEEGQGSAELGVEKQITLPPGWDRYAGLDRSRAPLSREGYQRLWRYALVDVREGVTRTMVDAPKGAAKTAASAATPALFWSADSAHVVLVNVGLPLTEEAAERREMGYLVDYEVGTGRWKVLESMVTPAGAVDGPHAGTEPSEASGRVNANAMLAGSAASASMLTMHLSKPPEDAAESGDATRTSQNVVKTRLSASRSAIPKSRVVEATRTDVAAGVPDMRKVQSVGWLSEGRELLVSHVTAERKAAGGTVYTLVSGGWQSREVAATVQLPPADKPKASQLANGVKVELRESANDPPMMMAREGKREVALTGPDPALLGVFRARQEPVRWTEREGHIEEGGLLLPQARSGPLPLVIQLGDYLPGSFRPDGSASTAYAAQALVAQGMAVLQMDGGVSNDYPQLDPRLFISGKATVPKTLETVLIVERIDSAVTKLAGEGIIDPKRVGLIGFSRTGFYTYYAITHPGRAKLAAVIVADSVTTSYGEYIQKAATSEDPARAALLARQYGGSFWQNKSTWIEHAPGFNVERVEAPALFTFNAWDPLNVPTLETVSAFRLANRELDVLLFPEGGHQIQRPLQRVASLQSSVDWMSFWLLGREAVEPNKAVQYRYWRVLREHKAAREAAMTPQVTRGSDAARP